MKEPRRLNRSGGVSQRLLDSASLDKPGPSARRHVSSLAATAGAFASTRPSGNSGVTNLAARRQHPAKTLAIWIAVGAAASVTLGLLGTKLLDSSNSQSAAAPLATLSSASAAPPVAVHSPDIAAEPASKRPRVAASAEALEIEAARAALSRGDAAAATAQLDAYDSSHPEGQLKPESMALRIQVLSNSGKTTEARTLANEFQGKYPAHPLVRQVVSGISK